MSSSKKPARRLGRGLASLMTNPAEVPAEQVSPVATEKTAAGDYTAAQGSAPGIQELPIQRIQANRYQPRQEFDDSSLRELADSLLAAGMVQPVVVRINPDDPDKYELIAGERRWRAAALAGLKTIPAIIRNASDQQSAELALIENLQREDLNPMERAEGLQRMLEKFQLSQSDLATRVGMGRPTVANLLRLNQLPEDVKNLIRNNKLTLGHGKLLLSITNNKQCSQIAAACAAGEWSVRKLREQIDRLEKNESAAPVVETKSAHISDLEKQLAASLGTKVVLREGRKKGTGKIVIEFYDLDQFDGLLEQLGVIVS